MNGVPRDSRAIVGADVAIPLRRSRSQRLDHPLGLNNRYITKEDVQSQHISRMDYLSCLFQNCTLRSFNGVVEGTKEQYRPGWKAYVSFMHAVLQADPLLHSPFSEWSQCNMGSAGIPYPVVVIRAFMEHLQFSQSHSGPLINSYLSAVRFNLLHSGVSIDFFAHPLVRAARAATEREWRTSHPEADCKTLPASVDFCIHLAKCALETKSPHIFMERWSYAIMAKTAFTCLLRVSEYMVTPARHHILAGSTTFERRQHTFPSGETVISFVSPAAVHSVPKHEITAVDYNVRSAKNDQPGVGHPFHMERVPVSDTAAFDVVGDLYDWCCVTRPPDEAPLFSWHAGTKWSSVMKFNLALKDTARSLGLPHNRVSSHSLRIGGASALAAAGSSDREIMILGRWKSLVFLNYVRSSQLSSSRSMQLIVDPRSFTTLDIHRLSRR